MWGGERRRRNLCCRMSATEALTISHPVNRCHMWRRNCTPESRCEPWTVNPHWRIKNKKKSNNNNNNNIKHKNNILRRKKRNVCFFLAFVYCSPSPVPFPSSIHPFFVRSIPPTWCCPILKSMALPAFPPPPQITVRSYLRCILIKGLFAFASVM